MNDQIRKQADRVQELREEVNAAREKNLFNPRTFEAQEFKLQGAESFLATLVLAALEREGNHEA